MTPICITGPDSLPALALQALAGQGLPQASALPRDPETTMQRWHQHVLATAPQPPGRVWQQLAAELVLANIQHRCWAWADPQSLPLLEFWAEFDESIRFVLVAETPAQAVLRRTTGPSGASQVAAPDSPDMAQILGQWLRVHQRLLHFALRHPERSQIVWTHSALRQPVALAEHLAQQWAIDWPWPASDRNAQAPGTPAAQATEQAAALKTAPEDEPCPLADHLARHLAQHHPQIEQLFANLSACITPLGTQADHLQADPLTLLQRYEALRSDARQKHQLAALEQALAQAHHEMALLQQDVAQAGQAAVQTHD